MPHQLDCINLYDISVIIESDNEKAEFKMSMTREICYYIINSQSTKHIDRKEIMQLPSEQADSDFLKQKRTEFADKMLREMNKSTQQ